MLQRWFPTYIRELELQKSLPVGQLSQPARFLNRQRFETIPPDLLPLCIVVCPGIIGSPLKSGNRQYRAIWRVGVGICQSAQTEEEADKQVKIYAACIRAMMLQKQGEYDSNNTEWLEEQYDDLPIPDAVLLFRAAVLWFGVDIENIVTKKPGPDLPDDEPYSYHTADTVEIDLEKEPVNG